MVLARNERKTASDLFDQQMWCWGWDIRRPAGNLLTEYGFHKERPPNSATGSSYYRFETLPQCGIGLWGFGMVFVVPGVGSIFLRRFDFAPRYWREDRLPEPVFTPHDLFMHMRSNFVEDPARADFVTGCATAWIARYEDWVVQQEGAVYRQQAIDAWRVKRKPVVVNAELQSMMWKDLSERLMRIVHLQDAFNVNTTVSIVIAKGKVADR